MTELDISTGPSILENEKVKEMLAVLEENKIDITDMRQVISHVVSLEKQLDGTVQALVSIWGELEQMKSTRSEEVTALKAVAQKVERYVGAASEWLVSVKNVVITNCDRGLQAFKEKGVTALSGAAIFANLDQRLLSLRNTLTKGLQAAENGIQTIGSISQKYHEAGRRVTNVGRVLADKELEQNPKTPGKLAKVLTAAFQKEKACFTAALQGMDKLITGLTNLEKKAAELNTSRPEKKPSVLGNIKRLQAKAAQNKMGLPITAKDKPKEPSL